MIPLVQAMIEIALHRRGPQDLPASLFLLGLVLAAYATVGFTSALIYQPGAGIAAMQVALDLLLFGAFFWIVLTMYRKPARWLQTFTALLGTGAILSLIAMPLHLWRQATGAEQSAALLPALGLFALLLWSLAVIGHILHHALEIPYLGGIVVAMGYFALNIVLFALMFPVPA
ncbi:MAG: hypothetical protein ACREVN_07380 [Gammaproteobacteria bacterium]